MLMTGADGLAQGYLAARIKDFKPSAADPAIAAVQGGKIIGAVAYQLYSPPNIFLSVAGEGKWLTPGNLAGWFWYPFEQLECTRCTALVHKKNKISRRFVERLGFKVEGVLREAAEDGKDLIIYGLLKRDCPHLKHLQKTKWVTYG